VRSASPELVVPRSVLELPQGDGQVVQVEAPAAVVEVDRPYRTTVEQEVLIVEIAIDQAERVRLFRQFPRRRPDHLERSSEQGSGIGRHKFLDESQSPIAVLARRVIADEACRRRECHRVDLPGIRQGVDAWSEEPAGRRPASRMLMQASLEDANSA
jgi:hypothetical protein